MSIKEIIDAERWEAGDHGLAPMPSVEHNACLDRIEFGVTEYVAALEEALKIATYWLDDEVPPYVIRQLKEVLPGGDK